MLLSDDSFLRICSDPDTISTNRLMVKLWTAIEDVKQNQQIHSAGLQSIQKQLQVASRNDDAQMPDDVKFPMSSIEEVDTQKQHIAQDPATKQAFECFNTLSVFSYGHDLCGFASDVFWFLWV